MEYLLQWEEHTLSPAWEYRVEMPSDELILDYAKRVLENAKGCCTRLAVWGLNPDRRVGTITLDKPKATVQKEI